MRPNNAKRKAATRTGVLAVLLVVGVLLAMLFPAIEAFRQAAMRSECVFALKRIADGLKGYVQVNEAFPAGCIYGTGPAAPSYPIDVWGAASAKDATGDKNLHGTSWILAILPHLEMESLFNRWDFTTNVAGNAIPVPQGGNDYEKHHVALCNVNVLYCVTRRARFRKETDDTMCLRTDGTWTGGGTDYGGCAGRVYGWAIDDANHAIQDPDSTTLLPPYAIPANSEAGASLGNDNAQKRMGIFGRPNRGTTQEEIVDGTSNTIMTGELQRIAGHPLTEGRGNSALPENAVGPSHDDWAVGGDATTFSTAVVNANLPDSSLLLGNLDFRSPGSDHAGVVNFGMADGSVRGVSIGIDPTVFALMGSMADGVPSE